MKTRGTSLFILSSLITLCYVSYAVILSSPAPALAARTTITPPSTIAVQATASMSQTLSTERIIFTMEYDDGGTDIFMMNAEDIINYEQIFTNLTKTPDVAKTMPQWSADGQHIYFLVENQETSTNLHTMKSDGTELTFLLEWPHPISSYDVSPDENWIVYSRRITTTKSCAIFKIRRNGSERTQLTDNQKADQCDQTPRWSPDGQLILFTSNQTASVISDAQSSLYTMRPDGSDLTQIVEQAGIFPEAVWSPNGQLIAINESNKNDKSSNLYIMRVDSGHLTQINDSKYVDGGGSQGDYSQITWSPDNEFLMVWSATYQKLGIIDLTTGTESYTGLYIYNAKPPQQPDWSPSFTKATTPVTTAAPISPTTSPVLAPQVEISATMLTAPNNDQLHDLILFTSSAYHPFSGIRVGLHDPIDRIDTIIQMTMPQLWAVSPDGQRAGRLSHFERGGAAYVDANPSGKPIFVEYDIHLNHPNLKTIRLPADCSDEDAFSSDLRTIGCGELEFSPNGRYLRFYLPEEICGKGLVIIDTLTEKEIYRTESGVYGFEFLSDGKALIRAGHCSGGSVSLFDPITQSKLGLGYESLSGYIWNTDKSALVTEVKPFRGVRGTQLWGYNIATDNYFLEEITFSDRPIWTADGSHLLYQFRPIDKTLGYNWNVYPRSRQIIKVNATTGQKTVLASDPNYDYDFCEIKFNTNDNKGCEQWYGDWIQLRRFPFEPLTVPTLDSTEPRQPDDYEKEQCLVYGKECATYPDLFALNWRTGELLPWDEAPIVPLTPTPPPSPSRTMKPDLSRSPVYSHPSGEYGFYVGQDNQSLWLVPQTGQPVLWVRDGENFIYVP